MLYIEQLHRAMVNIEVEIVKYKHQEEYVLTLVDLYKKVLDVAVSRILGELCNTTSIPLKHQFVLTLDGNVFLNNDQETFRPVHSSNILGVYSYSDIIPSEYSELDIEHILHFNQEVHEFKHLVLRRHNDTLALIAEFEGIDKMRLGITLI